MDSDNPSCVFNVQKWNKNHDPQVAERLQKASTITWDFKEVKTNGWASELKQSISCPQCQRLTIACFDPTKAGEYAWSKLMGLIKNNAPSAQELHFKNCENIKPEAGSFNALKHSSIIRLKINEQDYSQLLPSSGAAATCHTSSQQTKRATGDGVQDDDEAQESAQTAARQPVQPSFWHCVVGKTEGQYATLGPTSLPTTYFQAPPPMLRRSF